MALVGDDRGVTVQIGAVLLFGFLIVALSMYQATVVPDQNEEVEFNHNQAVQQDMRDVRSAVLRSGASGETVPTRVSLGTRYPSRALFVNPGPASGTLRTTTSGDGNVTVANAVAVDAEGETGDYWSGSNRTVTTEAIEYSPRYNRFRSAPVTVYEASVAYNRFDTGRNLTLTDQTLVDGRTISLITLNGSLGRQGADATTIDLRAVSPATRTVSVTNDSAGSVTIAVATRLDEAAWEDVLAEEFDRNGGFVAGNESGVTVDGDTLFVDLQGGVTYDLRMARVGVGTNVAETDAAYLTNVDPTAVSVPKNEQTTLTVEARDRFNSPVSGAAVSVTTPPEITVVERDAVTGSDGRANVVVNAGGDGSVTVNLSAPDTAAREVVFDVAATEGGGGGGGGDGPGDGIPGRSNLAAYVDSTDGDLKTIDSQLNVTVYDTGPADVKATGASYPTLSGDRVVFFVDGNNKLRSVDETNTTRTIDGSGSVTAARFDAGDWDGDDTTEIVYVRNGYLYEVEYQSGTDTWSGPDPICQKDNNACNNNDNQKIPANTISGIAAFTVADPAIVYVDQNSGLRIKTSPGDDPTGGQPIETVEGANGVGEPLNYDPGNPGIEIPIVDQNDDISLLAEDGGATPVPGGPSYQVGFSSMAGLNVKSSPDGNPDVIHVDNNDNLRYVSYDGTTGEITVNGVVVAVNENVGTT